MAGDYLLHAQEVRSKLNPEMGLLCKQVFVLMSVLLFFVIRLHNLKLDKGRGGENFLQAQLSITILIFVYEVVDHFICRPIAKHHLVLRAIEDEKAFMHAVEQLGVLDVCEVERRVQL